jgi:hypothetical protein
MPGWGVGGVIAWCLALGLAEFATTRAPSGIIVFVREALAGGGIPFGWTFL